MSYDIQYFTKETWNKPYEERKMIQVAPYLAEGGTVRAELVDGKLIPATVTDCEMNITYNYSKHYYEHIDNELGIRWIYGKSGVEVKERLEEAVRKLGIIRNTKPFLQINTDYTFGMLFNNGKKLPISEKKHKEYLKVENWDEHSDKVELIKIGYLIDGGAYWKSTPGNAGHALMRILLWIIQEPNGVFNGD